MLTRIVTKSITRPEDTTQYTAGDVVADDAGGMISFEGLSLFKESGAIIKSAAIISSQNASTPLEAELLLFSESFAIAADNAAFAPTDTQLEKIVASILFPSAGWSEGVSSSGADGNSFCTIMNLGYAVPSDLYGVIVARNAYEPVSAEKLTISLSLILNHVI